MRRPANEHLARLVEIDNIIPCRVKRDNRGFFIKLANSIEFLYPGELRMPITACCLSGDAFDLCDAGSSIQHKPWSVMIEGLVERVLHGIGTYSIWVKVGEQTLIARVPRSHMSGDVHRHTMVKLAFNPADAHFV